VRKPFGREPAAAGLVLGEPAPPGGLKATLKSADPSKLLISDRRDQLGSGSVTPQTAA